MKKTIFVLCLAFLVCITVFSSEGDRSIRVRVIANSDSAPDQSEKMRVVLALDTLLKNESFDSLEEAGNWIENNLDLINGVCRENLRNRSFTAEYREETYSDGSYQSLVVTLGKGKGHNFWGTLFSDIASRCAGARGKGEAFGVLNKGGGLVEIRFWMIDKLLELF